MALLALFFSFVWFTQKPAEDPCKRLPAADGNQCRVQLGGTPRPKPIELSTAELVNNYLSLDFTTVAERQEWISIAENSKPEDGNLFFCIEFSNLREINNYFKNKNIPTSVSNKYKEILMTLGQQLVKKWNLGERTFKYSDYKSYSGVYLDFRKREKSVEEFIKEKDLAFKAANQLFSEFLIENKIIDASTKPQDWFHAGIGFSADEAGISARVARFLSGKNGIKVYSNKAVQEVLKDVLDLEVRYREQLFSDLKDTDLFITTPKGAVIPHVEVFELLRKLEDPNEFKKALIDAFSGLDPVKARYLEKKLDLAVIERLQVYKNLVDTYSPSLMMAERNIASLEPAKFGGMSADFAGLGAQNMQALAEALALSGGNVARAILLARESEKQVTKQFKLRLQAFKKIVGRYYRQMIDTGDDFVAYGDSALSLANKKRLLNELAEFTPDSRKRIAFLAQNAVKEERNLIVAHGEAIERELRLILKGKMSQEKLSQLIFGIDMITTQAGSGTVQTLVGRPRTLTLSSTDWLFIIQSTSEAIAIVNSSGEPKKQSHYRAL